MKKLASLLAIFMLLVSMASARTILVTDTGVVTDPADGHLRGGVNIAVNSAVAGDIVVLAASATDYVTSPVLVLNGITLKGQNRNVTLNANAGPNFPLCMKNGAVLENIP